MGQKSNRMAQVATCDVEAQVNPGGQKSNRMAQIVEIMRDLNT